MCQFGELISKKGKNHILRYLVPHICECFHSSDENTSTKGILNHMSNSLSETGQQMLPAVPQQNKMYFPEECAPVWKVILQDAEIPRFTREMLDCLLVEYKDTISSNSSDIGYTKLIEMGIERDPKLSPWHQSHSLPFKYPKWV